MVRTARKEKDPKPLNLGLNTLQLPVKLLVLLQEDERGDGMRTQTDKAGNPPTEGPSKAFFAADIPQQAHNTVATALGRRSAHDSSLDHVNRTADSGSDETRHEGGCKVRAEVITHAGRLDAHFLEGIIRSQL